MAYQSKDYVLALTSLCPGLAVNVDFEVSDHGSGPFISRWERADLTQPTLAEIESVDTDALLREQATFAARDLMAQLVPDDYARIQSAIASSPALGLLWSALLAQGEAPISVGSDRFKQGWTGMMAALGEARARTIADALRIQV